MLLLLFILKNLDIYGTLCAFFPLLLQLGQLVTIHQPPRETNTSNCNMESSACRRRASDAEQSARPYSATAEREPAMVKKEPEWGECGASEAAVAEGLYAQHEIKVEIEIGPEVIQPQDIKYTLPSAECKMEEDLCQPQPAGDSDIAVNWTGTCPQQLQQFKLKCCFVRLQRISILDSNRCNTFMQKSYQENHSCKPLVQEKECRSVKKKVRSHAKKKPFSCDFCKSRFKHRCHLDVHTRTHTGEKPFVCDVCDSRFTQKTSLVQHIRIHTGEKAFSCDVCESRFRHKHSLERHRRIHTGEKPFSCDICKLRFTLKTTLTKHRLTHTGEKPFSCDVCQSQFTQRSTLDSHKRTHTDEKPFSCDVCSLRFTRKTTLVQHNKRIHTGEKSFSCDICESRFLKRSSLEGHIRTHTGEKPFSCDICKARFTLRSGLKRHMLQTHSGVKPFTCDLCSSRFAIRSSLTRHRRIHTGKKTFDCDDSKTVSVCRKK